MLLARLQSWTRKGKDQNQYAPDGFKGLELQIVTSVAVRAELFTSSIFWMFVHIFQAFKKGKYTVKQKVHLPNAQITLLYFKQTAFLTK